jgi:hypothetical protein
MGIPVLTSDFWNVRTDRIITNLREDRMLNEDLDGAQVQVYKGYPRYDTDKFAVFVYRSTGDEDEYSMGGDKVAMTATWAVVCISRHAGEPEELERLSSTFSANVLRNLMRHKQVVDEDGDTLWTTGTPGAADAATVRSEDDQVYEVELIPYVLWFELRLEDM